MESDPATLAGMFDRAAARYDLLNSILSLGQDGAWRRALCAPLARGDRVLDVCCGSARSAVAAYRRTRVGVIGVDASAEMLARGREHARTERAEFLPVRADALHLPFADAEFDAVTVAWGVRNLVPETEALRELRRVLRPGGWLHVLDSSSPGAGGTARVHRWYLRRVVPLIGRLSADPSAYRYLADSILAFGSAHEVAARIDAAGFECSPPTPLLAGAATVWRARRFPFTAASLQSARDDDLGVRIAAASGETRR